MFANIKLNMCNFRDHHELFSRPSSFFLGGRGEVRSLQLQEVFTRTGVRTGQTRDGLINNVSKRSIQCSWQVLSTVLDGLQKDFARFEKLAEVLHAHHHAVHATHDHVHAGRGGPEVGQRRHHTVPRAW